MGAYRKLHFWKKFIESFLIHAVDISTSIHHYNDVVVVGLSRVACYGKFEVFPDNVQMYDEERRREVFR